MIKKNKLPTGMYTTVYIYFLVFDIINFPLTNYSAARLDRSRVKYERLNKIIVSMKAGVGHLQDKLESTRDEVGGKKIELVNESVAEVLRECEMCMVNLTRRIKAAEDEKKRNRMTSMSGDEKKGDEKDDDFNNILPTFEFNQRIDLNDEEEDIAFDMDDDDGADMDDEEFTRERIKLASSTILMNVEKRKKKKGGKKGESP